MKKEEKISRVNHSIDEIICELETFKFVINNEHWQSTELLNSAIARYGNIVRDVRALFDTRF
ncbi:MAG: hypothetical protein LBI65_00570 [Candidatus Symbiothrix sp.]|jgi:hypothetical protein|nr:hypothetical protein [Candidatus Symbiothrix sp.]